MTTDAETGAQIDAAAVWRAIGRMEGDIAALKDGQEETNRRIEDTNRRLETGFLETNRRIDETNRRLETGFLETNRRIDETNRRIDRGTYAILAVGSGLLVAILAASFVAS